MRDPLSTSYRQIDRPRPSARCGRQKGGADHAIGRSPGGLSTKIHAVVDAYGLPVRIVLTPGQASDKTTFPLLIRGLALARDVIDDRELFARTIIDLIEAAGATAHIPAQCNVRARRVVDLDIYGQRNLVGRFFNKLKHFRRIATRFDKPARNYLATILLPQLDSGPTLMSRRSRVSARKRDGEHRE